MPDFAAGPFLIALDGSQQAEAGLAFGRELAATAGTEVVLVRGYDLVPPSYAGIGYYVPDLSEGLQEAARDYLAATTRPGERSLIARGTADLVIVDAAESVGASVVVMATEGLGRASRIALGSTTDRVLHSLKRPLFIIPPPADGAQPKDHAAR